MITATAGNITVTVDIIPPQEGDVRTGASVAVSGMSPDVTALAMLRAINAAAGPLAELDADEWTVNPECDDVRSWRLEGLIVAAQAGDTERAAAAAVNAANTIVEVCRDTNTTPQPAITPWALENLDLR